MGQPAFVLNVAFAQIDCGQCGGVYAINERFRKQCQDYGRSWTCPYCKTGWGFAGNSTLEQKEKELAEERRRLQAALSRGNELQMAKDKMERKLKRVGKGVCPDCNRTFSNLAAHMKCKHGK